MFRHRGVPRDLPIRGARDSPALYICPEADMKSISSIGTEGSAERLEALIAARARVLCRGTARKASAPR